MYSTSSTFKTKFKDGSSMQDFLMVFGRGDYVSGRHGDIEQSGISISEYLCSGDNIEFGELNDRALSANLLNLDGRFENFTWNRYADVMVGVQKSKTANSGAFNLRLTVTNNGNDYYVEQRSDGIYGHNSSGNVALLSSLTGAKAIVAFLNGAHGKARIYTSTSYIDVEIVDNGTITYFSISSTSENVLIVNANNEVLSADGTTALYKLSEVGVHSLTPLMVAHNYDNIVEKYDMRVGADSTIITEDYTETWEYLPIDTFLINPENKSDCTIEISNAPTKTALLDSDATSFLASLTYPKTYTQLVSAIATQTGAFSSGTIASTSIASNPFKGNNYTFRDIIQFVGEKTGTVFRVRATGGDTNFARTLYAFNVPTTSSGSYSYSEIASGAVNVGEDTTSTITKVIVKTPGGLSYESGSGDNVYTFYGNPLIASTDVGTMLTLAQALPLYYPCSFTVILPDPSFEIGDAVSVGVSSTNTILVPITSKEITWNGFLEITYSACGSTSREYDKESSSDYSSMITYSDEFSEQTSQTDVFNKLTNNGEDQGIYMSGDKVYINGEYIKANSIEAASIKADAIVIGATNLLTNTRDFGISVTKDTTLPKSAQIYLTNPSQYIGQTITWSFYRYRPSGTSQNYGSGGSLDGRFGGHAIVIYVDSDGSTKTAYPMTAYLDGTVISTGRVSQTYTIPSTWQSITSFSFNYQVYRKPGTDNDDTWVIKDYKVEVGNKATDWSPNPADQAYGADIYTSGTTTIDGGNITTGTIAANKLTITPLTAADVGSSGSTVIDGGRITTGTVTADRIGAGSFTMTGGSINITADTDTQNKIVLTHGYVTTQMKPNAFNVLSSSLDLNTGVGVRGISCVIDSENSYRFRLESGTGTNEGELELYNSSGNSCAKLSSSGLTFGSTGSYPATFSCSTVTVSGQVWNVLRIGNWVQCSTRRSVYVTFYDEDTSAWKTWGSMYFGGDHCIGALTYPVTFASQPFCVTQIDKTADGWDAWLMCDQYGNTTSTPQYTVIRPTTTSTYGSQAFAISYVVNGFVS